MTSSSHAYLPAGDVIGACTGTLRDIYLSRQEILEGIAERKRDRGKLLPRRSMKKAMGMLAEAEKEIARLHRSVEEKNVQAILDLAAAAVDDDPSFRIFVASGDFQIIKKFYRSEN